MTQEIIPFGPWRPDVALLDNQFISVAENVLPGANCYVPMLNLSFASTDVIPNTPRSPVFTARTTTGLDVFFVGTATKLYKWTHASGVWTDVTRSSGGNYALASGDSWSFAQFGTKVYATQAADVLQEIDATSGTNFAATAGSPPQAAFVKGVGDFLVLGGLNSNDRKIQWSSVNNPSEWTVGTNLGDEQEFPDGGPVRGIAGDVVGLVVQESSIRSMQFLPGDTDRIFAFSKVEERRGVAGKHAFTYTDNTLFFQGSDGKFYSFSLGGGLTPIGHNKINGWFSGLFGNSANGGADPTKWKQTLCFIDPQRAQVVWAYYNASIYDRLLVYDFSIGEWSYGTRAGQAWGVASDTNVVKIIGGVDTSGRFATMAGSPTGSIIDSVERHMNPGMRTFVSGVYPIIDSSSGSGDPSIIPYTRETLDASSTSGSTYSVNSVTGWAPVISSSRLHKFRVSFASGIWTQASGVMVEHQPDGEA